MNSGYERREGDKYYTAPWCVDALIERLDFNLVFDDVIWEPACGRGDITEDLKNFGYTVASSDIDISEFNHSVGTVSKCDFLEVTSVPVVAGTPASVIITNPPYGDLAEKFLRKALSFPEIRVVAMLLRSNFDTAKGRVDLFEKAPYAFELQLTRRPRWDWWLDEKPEKAHPFHPYSWFVWDRNWEGNSTKYWHVEEKRKKK